MSTEFVVPEGQTNTGTKQSNPYWFRENASYLYGVTSAPNNPRFGVEDISLKPATQNQLPHGILANGLLKTVVGGISFQIRKSKAGAPFVQTVSTVINKEQNQYWEHITLRPQVKAQVLRFFEALCSGQVPPPEPMYNQNFGGFNNQFAPAPQNNGFAQPQNNPWSQVQSYQSPSANQTPVGDSVPVGDEDLPI